MTRGDEVVERVVERKRRSEKRGCGRRWSFSFFVWLCGYPSDGVGG